MIENEMDADAFYNDEMKKVEPNPTWFRIRCEDFKVHSSDGETLVRFYLDNDKYAFSHLVLTVEEDGNVKMRILNEEQ